MVAQMGAHGKINLHATSEVIDAWIVDTVPHQKK